MTYNERLRAIAEEMAWEVHKDHDPDSYGNLSKQFLPAARIAVKHMFDTWMDCWRMNNPYVTDEEEGLHYARYKGLIPDSEPEILPTESGDRMYRKRHDPDNPEPENWQL